MKYTRIKFAAGGQRIPQPDGNVLEFAHMDNQEATPRPYGLDIVTASGIVTVPWGRVEFAQYVPEEPAAESVAPFAYGQLQQAANQGSAMQPAPPPKKGGRPR